MKAKQYSSASMDPNELRISQKLDLSHRKITYFETLRNDKFTVQFLQVFRLLRKQRRAGKEGFKIEAVMGVDLGKTIYVREPEMATDKQGLQILTFSKQQFLQFHQQLTNKKHLYLNLVDYCLRNRIDYHKFLPPTFVFDATQQDSFQNAQNFVKFFLSIEQGHADPKRVIIQSRKIKSIFGTGSKYGKSAKIPKVVPEFCCNVKGKTLWLFKPTGLNCGRGIKLFTNIDQLIVLFNRGISGYVQLPKQQEFFKQKKSKVKIQLQMSSPIKKEKKKPLSTQRRLQIYNQRKKQLKEEMDFFVRSQSFVIQKYLQRPFLIEGRKFDIRLWVLLDHMKNLYLFKQGYIRLSSMPYSTVDVSNKYIHLTNNAVQKYCQNYGKQEDGNQKDLKYLQTKIRESKSEFDLREDLMRRIKEIVVMSFRSASKRIDKNKRNFCFQLFGFDFILDQNIGVWLIQINTNPSIDQSSPLLQKLIPRMLDDCFRLTIDKIFTTKRQSGNFLVEGYTETQNLFEYLITI